MGASLRTAALTDHPDFVGVKFTEPTCPGWGLVERPSGELRLALCDSCGLPEDRVEAAVAALTAVEALFGARFGDDVNGVLEVLEEALVLAIDHNVNGSASALACVQAILKSIREAAEE